MTGIRSWMGATSSLGDVVRIVNVSSGSSPRRQASQRPAKPKGWLSFMRMKCGCLGPAPRFCQS